MTPFNTTHTLSFLLLSLLLVTSSLASATKTLTIRGTSTDPGDVIQLPDGASLDLRVNEDGIVVTLPDVKVQVRCLGEPTEDGYCLITANEPGGAVGSGNDSDGDGIFDEDDNCFATAENSFVNSSGCSQAQLGDNDTDSDTGNDTGNDTDNDTDSDTDNDDPPPTGGYCSSPASTRVTCSASLNLDNWTEASSAAREYTIQAGKILSLPFTVDASTTDQIALQYDSQQNLSGTGFAWRSWISMAPGGAAVGDEVCVAFLYKASRYTMYLTQDPNSGDCSIGASAGTRYVNYAVVETGDVTQYSTDITYRFNMDKSE